MGDLAWRIRLAGAPSCGNRQRAVQTPRATAVAEPPVRYRQRPGDDQPVARPTATAAGRVRRATESIPTAALPATGVWGGAISLSRVRCGSPYAASPPSNVSPSQRFVLGVIAIVLSWIPLFGHRSRGATVILGGLGISRANRTHGTGKGFAIAGLVLGAISILVTFVVFAILVAVSKPTG